jgi:hypothetical protein
MPRYYFNVLDDMKYVQDKSGCELSGIGEAKRELLRLLHMLPDSLQHPGVCVSVVDEHGTLIAEEWIKGHKL